MRYTAIVGAASAISASLAACGGSDESESDGATGSRHGTIQATLAFTLSSGFDPMNASSAVATAVNQHVFEALIDLHPVTREPYLALAKQQPIVSADGLTWTVDLRDGARFSDGTPVAAEDVAWSFTRAADPANKALMGGFIPFVASVTAKGASTVEFKLKTPFSLFPQRLSVIKIVPKAKTLDAAASKAFDTAPIGSGPFKVDRADATSGVELSYNPNYNGAKPARVDKIVLHTTPNSSARLNDLRGGQSQVVEAVPYLDVAGVESQFQVDKRQAFNLLFLMFNCSAAPFSDKRVRQALFHAIDTGRVISTALRGNGKAASSYVDEGNAGYQKAATVYSYNPEKAKQLLGEAGFANLSFELVTTDTAFIKDSAPIIIDSWKQIGVTATLNTNPSSAVYGTIVPSNGFRVLAASGDPSVFGPDLDLLLRWYYYGTTWPVSRMRWTDSAAKECAALLDKAAESGGDAQKVVWKQILDLVAEEVPLYPVFHTQTVTGSDPGKLENFRAAATTGLYFLDVARKG